MIASLPSPSDRLLTNAIRVAAVFGASAALVSVALSINVVGLDDWIASFDWFMEAFAVFFAVPAFRVADRMPRNPLVWIMAISAFCGGLTTLGWPVAWLLGGDITSLAADPIPADLSPAAAWMIAFTGWLWVPALIPPLTFGLLLFPDGHLPSPRWRWLKITTALAVTGMTVDTAWSYRPWSTVPVEDTALIEPLWSMVLLCAIGSVIALVQGFRRSSGMQREQFKWVLWGTSVFVPTFLGLGFIFGGSSYESLLLIPILIAELVFLWSYAVAITRYRLLDIDHLISRTLSYTALLGLLALGFFGLVAATTYVLPTSNSLVVAMSTLAVAAAFNPLRLRLHRVVDRHFNRSAYQIEAVVAGFAAKVRESLTIEELAEIWDETVSETFRPEAIGIWLNPHVLSRLPTVDDSTPGVVSSTGAHPR